jgi:RecA/RadA recombinase
MKTFDPTKFRRKLVEKLEIPVGFSDPKIWISTGNFALNRLISGDYNRGFPLSKVNMLAGESGSGKSLIAAQVMRNAQIDHNAFVVLLDSEGAGDEEWLKNAGVDTVNNFMRIPVFTVTTCTEMVAEFIMALKDSGSDQPVIIVLDSVGMLETESGQDNFKKGEAKGDQGQLAKQLKRFIKNCIYLCEQKDIGFLMTNHTYASQDMFNPDAKITGGDGIVYASSIVIAMRKFKLKEVAGEDEVNTSTGVHGIKTTCMSYKTRYNKPFEKTTIEIPWSTGLDPYSGLLELFEMDGLLVKDGNKLKYTAKNGDELKFFKKQWKDEHLQRIMDENPYSVNREEKAAAARLELEMSKEAEVDTEEATA